MGTERRASRPIPIDREKVREFVRGFLVPSIVHQLKARGVALKQKLVGSHPYSVSKIDAIGLGGGTFVVDLYVVGKENTSRDEIITGGKAWTKDGKPSILIFLNGDMEIKRLLKDEKFLIDSLYLTLLHELTHTIDEHFDRGSKRQIDYFKKPVKLLDLVKDEEIDFDKYLNNPLEVRAFMQEVAAEVLDELGKGSGLQDLVGADKGKRIRDAIYWSSIWQRIRSLLSSENRRKILQGVYGEISNSDFFKNIEKGKQTMKTSSVDDVVEKIEKRIWNKEMADNLIKKVKTYNKTKRQEDDLTLPESGMIYREDDYGDELPLSKKRKVDIEWSNHAEYRSDLRDVNPDDVNSQVVEKLKNKLVKPEHKKVTFKNPGSTMVVDYDTKSNPAEAEVITVWARIAKGLAAEFGVLGIESQLSHLPGDIEWSRQEPIACDCRSRRQVGSSGLPGGTQEDMAEKADHRIGSSEIPGDSEVLEKISMRLADKKSLEIVKRGKGSDSEVKFGLENG